MHIRRSQSLCKDPLPFLITAVSVIVISYLDLDAFIRGPHAVLLPTRLPASRPVMLHSADHLAARLDWTCSFTSLLVIALLRLAFIILFASSADIIFIRRGLLFSFRQIQTTVPTAPQAAPALHRLTIIDNNRCRDRRWRITIPCTLLPTSNIPLQNKLKGPAPYLQNSYWPLHRFVDSVFITKTRCGWTRSPFITGVPILPHRFSSYY